MMASNLTFLYFLLFYHWRWFSLIQSLNLKAIVRWSRMQKKFLSKKWITMSNLIVDSFQPKRVKENVDKEVHYTRIFLYLYAYMHVNLTWFPLQPLSWIIKSLYSGELLPFTEENRPSLLPIANVLEVPDSMDMMSEEI